MLAVGSYMTLVINDMTENGAENVIITIINENMMRILVLLRLPTNKIAITVRR